jgi:hypothetical protein
LDTASPLFVSAAPLTVKLFDRMTGSYEKALGQIRVRGGATPAAIPVSSAYYRAMMKTPAESESPHRFEMQELLQLTELFFLNPTLESSAALSRALIDASAYFDSMSLILGRLIGIEGRFAWVIVVSNRCLKAADQAIRKQFLSRLSEAHHLKPKSRVTAMQRLAEGRVEDAFRFALLESDDEIESQR